jgi:hypothetical protein
MIPDSTRIFAAYLAGLPNYKTITWDELSKLPPLESLAHPFLNDVETLHRLRGWIRRRSGRTCSFDRRRGLLPEPLGLLLLRVELGCCSGGRSPNRGGVLWSDSQIDRLAAAGHVQLKRLRLPHACTTQLRIVRPAFLPFCPFAAFRHVGGTAAPSRRLETHLGPREHKPAFHPRHRLARNRTQPLTARSNFYSSSLQIFRRQRDFRVRFSGTKGVNSNVPRETFLPVRP